MDPDEPEDDLGIHITRTGIPINTSAPDDNGRSQRLGQQRTDFNISPPTIPRSNTANIFSGGAFRSTSGQPQPFSTNRFQQIPQHFAQGHIPSYSQESNLSSQIDPQSDLRWQSSIVPQAQYGGASQHYFTPLHTTSNEESKLSSIVNAVSPAGVMSPGLVTLTSPIHRRPANIPLSSLSSPPPTGDAHRSVASLNISTTESTESIESDPRPGRHRRNRRTAAQRRQRTPNPLETPINENDHLTSRSPPPQNLRGDPFRSAKVKTELCRHYNTPKGCAFGANCNYAHGDHELKYTKLMDLERASLVDVEIFRTRPCPTWVATGGCPFDQRCIGLHDPRVEGSPSSSAWLPHAETLINKIGSGANVDKFYHERLASIYNACPIYGYIPKLDAGSGPLGGERAWRHFYDFVCNTRNKPSDVPFDSNKHVLEDLSEEHKLEIVLKMRQNKLLQEYAYIPTHLCCGDLCMILQRRTFQLISVFDTVRNKFSFILEEVTGDYSVRLGALKFEAYEIAFGPVGDPTVRPSSVCFDIPKDDLTPCTPQQAKHHKRSRHRIKKTPNRLPPQQGDSSTGEKFKSMRITPFFHYQPLEHISFDLITSILVHRLKMIKFLSGGFDKSLHKIGPLLESEGLRLKQKFLSLLQFWILSSWPEEPLEEPIHDDTDVPSVDGRYSCVVHAPVFFRASVCVGLGSKRFTYNLPLNSKLLPSILWKSFAMNMLILKGGDFENIQRETVSRYDNIIRQLHRLPALRHLSMGGSMVKNRYLPHIKTSRGVGPSSLSQCIEDLLRDWDELKDHYDEHGNVNTPLRRPSSNQTLQGSQTPSEGSDETELERHLRDSARMWTRMSL